ncbi:pentatricopeptide repeat-containing protein At5g27110 [Selaginella moellendorffii]|nr:pentatricopeptide repeat-containing protein At5g27110 [Selaginella moellendorffii]|eukprot:XP_002983142.2 pentatricopeptide repeat-containing protein At5g27110 [Selaginella moellendorffii]
MAAALSSMAMAIAHRRKRRNLDWRDKTQTLRGQHHGSKVSCAAFGYKNSAARSPDEDNLKILVDRMQGMIHKTDSATYARVLRVCAKNKALQQGKKIHSYIRDSGQEQDRILGNHLIEMYLKCGSLRDAQRMFDEMVSRDAILWTSMISAYSERGHYKTALKLFQRMQGESVKPDNVTFVTVLNCCGKMSALQEGKLIHSQLTGNGFENDLIVKTALLNMYGKCGSLTDARKVFEEIQGKDIITWNAMLSVYVQHSAYEEALELYRKMELTPSVSTFVTVINACAGATALEDGRQVHAVVTARGLETEDAVSSALLNMYGKCGSLEDAAKVFWKRREYDDVAWAHMISFYTQWHRSKEALGLFRLMRLEGVRVDKFAFTTTLSACNGAECLAEGRLLHAGIEESGFESDVVVRSALIHMYGRCGLYDAAWELFQSVPTKNVLLSSAMIATCERHGHWRELLDVYQNVQSVPYKLTIISVLKACAELQELERGKAVHESIKGKDLYQDGGIREALLGMYCKCGALEDAQNLFDRTPDKSTAFWNALLDAYVKQGQLERASELFEQMQANDVEANEITVACVSSLREGSQVLETTPENQEELCRQQTGTVELVA